MILRASYITLVAVTPSPRTDLQKFVLFDSVEQLGSSVAAIPPQARVNLNEVCGKLQEKIKDHEDNIEILREKLAPMIIKRIDPASIQVKSRDDMVSTILAASQTQDFADLLTKIPPWMRYLVQQGLDAVLVEPMSTLYMPLPSSSTGAKVAGRRMGKKKTMKKAK
jgi:hypothetical protein